MDQAVLMLGQIITSAIGVGNDEDRIGLVYLWVGDYSFRYVGHTKLKWFIVMLHIFMMALDT